MLILHGENIVISRKQLTERIDNFNGEIIRLDGEKVEITNLKQALESASLFGQDRLVIIENLFSRRPSKIKEEILTYLKKEFPENLIIWEGKKVDGRILTAFNKAKIDRYDLSPVIFKFLDSFWPGNQRNLLFLFHQSLKSDPPELIFFMLSRLIKDLIIAHDLGASGLESIPLWQKEKLIRQAKKFKFEKLMDLYKELLLIDFSIKSGRSPIPLTSQLDLFLASL